MPWKKSELMDKRMEFRLKALRSENVRELCREYGISAKTGYKWRERVLREGSEGMEDQSRRPTSHAESLEEKEVCEIIPLKHAHTSWGPRKIREMYYRQQRREASESHFKREPGLSGVT